MALKFTKIEPIDFGGTLAVPKVTEELRLRLAANKATTTSGEAYTELVKNIAECFDSDKYDYIFTFITDNFTDLDLAYLKTYLLQGQRGVELLQREVDKQLSTSTDVALREMQNG